MKILMISTDRALLGENISTGDALERHRHYAAKLEKLDIIIFSRPGYQTKELAANLFCYPTNSSSKLFYLSQTLKIAKQLFNQGSYDLIICQDPFLTGLAGCFLSRKYTIKLLIHFHGDFWHNKYWLKENVLNFLLLILSKFTVSQADALRVVSPGIQAKLVKSGIKQDKIRVISTPVNLANFATPDNQTVTSLQHQFEGKKIVFWLGRFSPEKNLPFLLESFKTVIQRFPNAILLLGGQGKEFDRINKLKTTLGLSQHVKLLGHLDYLSLPNYYHAAHLFILPSLHESFGKVLLEAGASAKPSIASATTGASAIIQHAQTGFLVEINNHQQFVDYLLKLLKDDKLAQHMGSAAYSHIHQQFNYQQGIKRLVKYWEEIAIGFNPTNSKIS